MQVIAHGIYRFRELLVTSPTIARALLAIAQIMLLFAHCYRVTDVAFVHISYCRRVTDRWTPTMLDQHAG